MSAPHPRMHGLTHVMGGPDPVPFLPGFPTGDTLDDKIMGAGPAAWWKLDETEGVVAHDSSGNGHDLTASGGFTPPTWGQPAGPPGTTTAEWVDANNRVSSSDADTMAGFTDDFTAGVWVNTLLGPTGAYELVGQGTGGYHGGSGWALLIVSGKFAVGVAGTILYANNPWVAGTWYMVAVVRDAGVWKLYVNGLLQGSTITTDPGSPGGTNTWLGNDAYPGHGTPLLNTFLSYAFIVDRPMSGAELEGLVDVAETPPVTDHTGYVLGIDENGNPAWIPQTVEVSGGGVNPAPVDETPADSSHPAGSGPTTSSGWHLDAHVETVVLHDPNPGRFDVPTMKWVRVPFTSITIYRTWEPTVDAEVLKTARLKDDRGLMQAAKNGILHINPDMAWPDAPPIDVWLDDDFVSHSEQHHVEGWFSIEYPVLDARYLPENDVELLTLGPTPPAPRPGVDVLANDGYQRGSRFMNLSTGSVLRANAGVTDRAIANWWFWGEAEISTGGGDGPGTGSPDNPFPIWGDWPARPIHMTPPYPQMNPTDSKAYYQDSVGMAGYGFGPHRGLGAGANLSAGANLCMQAWQDSPWLLRFSTARFPAYRGYDADYNGFPHLAVTYHYDPDTINHTTGKLLLPAT